MKFGMHLRLLISLTLLFWVGLILLGAVLFNDANQRLNQFRETQARYQAKTLAEGSLDALVTQDFELLERWVSSAMPSDEYAYAALVRPNGQILSHSRLELIGQSIITDTDARYSTLRQREYLGRPIMEAIYPARINKHHLANAHVAYYLDVGDNLQAGTILRIIASLLASFLVLVAGTYFITRHITAPIKRLRKTIANYSLDRPIDIEADILAQRDEVGSLAQTMSTISRRLTDSYQKLSDSLKINRAIVDSSLDGIVVIDKAGQISSVNTSGERIFGQPAAALIGQPIQQILQLQSPQVGMPEVHPSLDLSAIIDKQQEVTGLRHDGSTVPLLLVATRMDAGPMQGHLLTFHDISEHYARKKTQFELSKFSGALDQIADSVFITNQQGIIEYVNPAFEALTGYTAQEALGRTPRLLKSGRHDNAYYQILWDTIKGGGVFRDVLINAKKNDTVYYEEITITPLTDATGNITHFIATGKDITERMQSQERLHYLAHHDLLTDLPNRALLLERLEHRLSRASRTHDKLAVLFLDLDRFKNINDSLGHLTGDRLLKQLAQRLQSILRDGDTVARLGGDEFIILLEDISDINDVSVIADKILDGFSQPFLLEQQDFFITTSIGISVYPLDGQDSTTLIKNADTAMYRAKEVGGNNYKFYSPEMSTQALQRLVLETGLRHALEREEFVLHYQPQLNLASGELIGMEALLRWQHPELGLISPTEFIPLLEETGLIIQVGEWVLRTACAQNMSWRNDGLNPGRIAINLSGRQFAEKQLLATVTKTLSDTGLSPSQLDLEITESILMGSAENTIDTLTAFSKMGIHLSIDDFGTGYSSLSYLKRFPINTLKIDRSFVQDLPHDADDAAIVKTIAAMAGSLKLEVLAEGVENQQQADFLRGSNCYMVQGYMFSRPLAPDEMTAYLNR